MNSHRKLVWLATLCFGWPMASQAQPAFSLSISSGNNQSGVVGSTLAIPLVVQVQDGAGSPVAGIAVAFTAINAMVDPASVNTDSLGRAATRATLGSTVGPARIGTTVGTN